MKIIPRSFLTGLLVLAALCRLARADENPLAAPHGYTVTLDVKIDETGKPESIGIVSSEDKTAGEVLTKMALAMAVETKFPPHIKDGHAVKYTARVPYFFPIEGDEGPEANNQPKPTGKSATAVMPSFPLAEAQRGEAGGVILELNIDTQGKIAKLTTLRASNPDFEAAAVQAVKQWTFLPAMKDGQPVDCRWRIAIVFDNGKNMAGLRWRVAPRPSLGSWIVVHNPVPAREPAPSAAAATPTTPVPETPAK